MLEIKKNGTASLHEETS